MVITEALGAIFGGGLTGLFGSAITAYSEIKKQSLQFKHDEKMEELALQMTKLETEANFKIVEVETAGKVDVAEVNALTESYKVDRAAYSQNAVKGKVSSIMLVFVDVLRGLIRPLVTFYFTVLISILFFKFYRLYGNLNDLSNSAEILDKIVVVILYIGVTCILWWFGTRQKIISNKL